MADDHGTPEPGRTGGFSKAAGLFFIGVVIVSAVLALALLERQPPNLEVFIQMDATEFSPGDPIVVHARLVNNDDVPVDILSPAVADLTFEVIVHDDQGRRYEKHVPYQPGMEPQPELSEIQPGQSVTVDEDIRYGYGIVPGRRYHLRAAYRTLNFPDENVWYGVIKSNRAHIFVRHE